MDFETPPPSEDQPKPTPSPNTESESEPAERERRGAARERYERRKQHAAPRPVGAAPRQIRAPQEFKVPAVKIPGGIRTLIGAVGAVLLVVVLVLVLGRVRNNASAVQPNALWLDTGWTYQADTDDSVKKLVDNLRTQKIGAVYAYVTYLQADGTWRNEDKFDKVKAFVKQFKTAYPEAKLDGWIGLPTENAASTTRLGDVNLQQQVADFSKRMISEFGFDGVFIDAEPVWDGDQNYLALLRAIRASVGISTQISAAIPPDWSPSNSSIPLPPLITPGTEWAKDYKKSVALLVDHMVVMAYQSSLTSAADYTQWVAYQVQTFATAVAELNTDKTDLIIGIPTFPAEPPGHDPAVENIDSAVQGVKLGIQQAGDAGQIVKGLAIYGSWTTDDTQWADFQKVWVQSK